MKALVSELRSVLCETSQPRLNKYDPGSLLGWTVYLLKKYGLDDAADKVRDVSRDVSKAWQEREKVSEAASSDRPPTKEGQRVRVLDGQYKGQSGEVLSFGGRGSWYATVKLDDEDTPIELHVRFLRKL